MSATNERNSLLGTLVTIVILLFCFIAVPFGLVGVWPLESLTYIMPAVIAVIAFAFALGMLLREKRISFYVVATFIMGLLFLASATIQFGFSSFEQNLSNHARVAFYRVMRPDQMSRGLTTIGMGIGFILTSVLNLKMKIEDSIRVRRNKVLGIVFIGVGIIFLFLGVYTVINGFQPLS